jgi:hypothetical protein
MKSSDLGYLRLYNQSIAKTTFDRPADVVKWLGAVQAQDYIGALWAVGLRTNKATEADVVQAVADKEIVRTWPMRGTLHFVPAEDIHWMLELLTPRIIVAMIKRSRYLELNERVITRSRTLIERTLEGGKQLPRATMYKVLEAAKISTAGGRGLHILSRLAHERVLCFGAREGKQPTFALLDEWVPSPRRLARDEALAELTGRYFTSHGPATLQDFIWWSGLPASDARVGLEMAKSQLVQETIYGHRYWLASSLPTVKKSASKAYLLPSYDEYAVAYRDRSAVLDPIYSRHLHTGNGVFSPIVVIDSQIVGTWKRSLNKDTWAIKVSPFAEISETEICARAAAAAKRYEKFLGAPVAMS